MSELANVSSSILHEFMQKLEVTRWAVFALWLVFFVVGVPGNLLILCVYRTKRVRTTTHVFIGALAVADLMTCLLRFVDAVRIASVSRYLEHDRQSVVYFLSQWFVYTTALLTTAVALDRFDAVCRSLRRTLTIRRAKIGAVACFAVGFAGILPEASHKIYLVIHDEEADTFIVSVMKLIPVSLYIISLFAVTVFYGVIFAFVRKHRRIMTRDLTQQPAVSTIGSNTRHQAASNSVFVAPAASMTLESAQPPGAGLPGVGTSSSVQPPQPDRQAVKRQHPPNSQSRTTKMLFVATFMFFILWLPTIYLRVYAMGSLFEDFMKSSSHGNLVAALVVVRDIIYFNSVINVFIYGLANKRFRVECQMLIQRLRIRV